MLVEIDRLSKYVHIIPIKYPYSAHNITHIFVNEFVRLYEIPISIVSDRLPL